jgi:bifunctional DNA-binding transcriptional regulator/antitoxin component of YhaV-PrlF toxin-antitoxin module
MNAIRGRVSESGRLGLPAELRKAVGLDRGGDVVIELDGADIRIRTVREVVARAQALSNQLLADKSEGSVDAFLAERRKDAEREG